MSVSNDNDSTVLSTIDDGRALFLELCVNMRKDDPSILPEVGRPFNSYDLSEIEDIELADALLENSSVTYLQLDTTKYTKSSAEAMANYARTSI